MLAVRNDWLSEKQNVYLARTSRLGSINNGWLVT